jgi:dihydroorotase
MSLVIKGGKAFVKGEFIQGDILIEDGIIKEIASGLKGEETINADGLLVLPGLIDSHVHLREPGGETKEDFRTGTQAAVAGGFTTVIDMPNNSIPTTTKDRLEEKRALAAEKALCDVFFHFGTTDSNFDEVIKADPLSLKVYMGHTTGELMLKEEGSLERHFSNFDADKPIVVHASHHSKNEEENLEKTYKNEEFAIKIAEKYNQKIYLAHVSAAHEVDVFGKYQRATFETAPHYLFLNSQDAERLGDFGTVYPPLRSEETRKGLWGVLEHIDCIATDHAPHTKEDKKAGAHGFPGLETSLSLMLDAYHRNLLDLGWIIERMSSRPADIFNLKGKGRINQGYQADITLVDLKKEWTVKEEELFTKCRWSPFEGRKLKGKVHSVIYKGKKIFEEGEFI